MPDPRLDRSVSALLGSPFEGLDRDSYPRVTDDTSARMSNVVSGAWIDDVATPICLAESLLAATEGLLERFLRMSGEARALTSRATRQ